MIETRELRAGNLIYEVRDTHDNPRALEIFKVAGLNILTNTLTSTQDNITQADYCEPIQLTPALLEKAGFKHFTQGWYVRMFNDNRIALNLYLSKMVIDDQYYSHQDGASIGAPCKFLHQLQNLYFALTGEELPIDPY